LDGLVAGSEEIRMNRSTRFTRGRAFKRKERVFRKRRRDGK